MLHGIAQIAITKLDRLHGLAVNMAGTIGDLEAPVGGAVDQMGGGTEIVTQIFLGLDEVQDFVCVQVTIFGYQAVDLGVFTKFLEAGGQDDQFALIGHGHPCPVDALVAQPGALELFRLQIDDDLGQGLVHHLEVDLQGEVGGFLETFDVVSGIEPAQYRAIRGAFDNCLQIDDRQLLGKVFGGIV